MIIYIDESGSFVNAPKRDSWNVVTAYASPEIDNQDLERCLYQLKLSSGFKEHDEIKLKDITEDAYLDYLEQLSKLNGVVFCAATDAGLNGNDAVREHQKQQVLLMSKDIDKMKFESGREAIRQLISQIEGLSPQLYVQLFCQIDLMFDVVGGIIPYFVQRLPSCLGKFSWRIDQKNISKIDFEDAFEKISPIVLQTKSISDPLVMINGCDYSFLDPYNYEKGSVPEYLKDTYGIEIEEGIDIQKIIREDIEFVDSKVCIGV